MILAIDPGLTGALCLYDPETKLIEILDMPVLEVKRGKGMKHEISPYLLRELLYFRKITKAYIEKVGAMPGQGTSSMFQFGRGVGQVEGVLAGLNIPVEYVTPQAWIKGMGVRGGKDGSREKATQLLPQCAHFFQRKKDHGRADACLIALYKARVAP